jgi:hypothetical protein
MTCHSLCCSFPFLSVFLRGIRFFMDVARFYLPSSPLSFWFGKRSPCV